MIISDINYLETANSEVVGAGGYYDAYFNKRLNSDIDTNLNFNARSDIWSKFNKDARINVNSHVTGNSSTFAFDNEAVGYGSNTQGELNQLAVAPSYGYYSYTPGISSQNGLFVAAAN